MESWEKSNDAKYLSVEELFYECKDYRSYLMTY